MKQSTNIIVIGGGTAGVAAALQLRHLGKTVTIVDEHGCSGGDRLIRGMVQAFVDTADSSDTYHTAHLAAKDYERQERRLQALKHQLQSDGISVITGRARFNSFASLVVGHETYRPARFVIATGSSTQTPDIPGASGLASLMKILELPTQPERLAVIGLDELTHKFARALAELGTKVSIVASDLGTITPAPNVQLITATASSIEHLQRSYQINLHDAQHVAYITTDAILLAGKPKANIDLSLDAAGVRHSAAGITTNRNLQTSNPLIFAAGSCLVAGRDRRSSFEQGQLAATKLVARV